MEVLGIRYWDIGYWDIKCLAVSSETTPIKIASEK